jgi:phage regulator Rha-like protein
MVINSYKPLNEAVEEKINQLTILQENEELSIDSRNMAKALGIEHESLFRTIKDNGSSLSYFGHLRFEIGTVVNSVGAVNKTNYCLLNEDQATFIATLSRNTEQVILFKICLVKAFSVAKQKLSNPQNIKTPTSYIEALENIIEVEKRRLKLEQKIEIDKPLVNFALNIKETTNSLSFEIFAKELCKNGFEIGSKRLFEYCRTNKLINEDNIPYQTYMKYFELKPSFYFHPKNGDKVHYTQTLINSKGQIYLSNRLVKGLDIID